MISDENTEEVEDFSENTEDVEIYQKERKPRSKERGPDRKPRTIRVSSMKNLSQFSNRPDEFVTYLKDEKGVNITGKPNTVKIVLVIIGIMVAVLAILYVYDIRKSKQENPHYWQ